MNTEKNQKHSKSLDLFWIFTVKPERDIDGSQERFSEVTGIATVGPRRLDIFRCGHDTSQDLDDERRF